MQPSKDQPHYHPEQREQLWLALVLGIPMLLVTALEGATLRQMLLDETTLIAPKWRLVWNMMNHNQSRRQLVGADLSQANLYTVYLRQADLTDANLAGALLAEADLTGADLSATILSGAILTGTILTDAKRD